MECRKHVVTLLILGLWLSLCVAIAYAEATPEGPTTLTIESTSRRTPVDAPTIPALAGNVTQLTIDGQSVTQTWQGYYGNITGTITLDDASNHTMYDWTQASPKGEIYAATSTLDWTASNVKCWDYTMSDAGQSAFVMLTEYETALGLIAADIDGVDETFKQNTAYDDFYVGAYHVNDVTCPSTQIYTQNAVKNANDYQEVLLYDNTSNVVVYTSIIEQVEPTGFNDQPWDFEMLVGENGHLGNTATTPYYFYVELS